MKLLLTGHSGFVGQYLLPQLRERYHVFLLQNDLRDHAEIQQEIRRINPNIVLHLAARTEVQQSFYEPNVFTDINYSGTVNLIESCRSECTDLRLFAFASTMEVYGWQPVSDEVKLFGKPLQHVAFDENTIPQPNAPYAVAKRACELYLQFLHRSIGFPFVALRQTNSYGRHDNDFFVTEQIITQMLQGQSQINLGYPEPFRNFLHIDDLISAWLAVLDNHSVTNGKLYTIGPDNPVCIADYADKIAGMIGWQGSINWHTKPHRIGEIYWLNSNHDLITQDTGWKPILVLDDGLVRTISLWQKKTA